MAITGVPETNFGVDPYRVTQTDIADNGVQSVQGTDLVGDARNARNARRKRYERV